ncbi:MAG: transcriptional regulator [Kineosporiaceae bacterium]|nr:transcriptional regulator [Aeromicrobium sp.]
MGAEPRFNEVIHAPLRLRICGLLRVADEIDFAVLREALVISDVNLSKHLKALVEAGLVTTTKSASTGRTDLRRVTWCKLTGDGRNAFDAHVEALRLITAGAGLDPQLNGLAQPQIDKFDRRR